MKNIFGPKNKATNEPVVRVDRTGIVRYVNNFFTETISPWNAVVGNPFVEIFDAKDRPSVSKALSKNSSTSTCLKELRIVAVNTRSSGFPVHKAFDFTFSKNSKKGDDLSRVVVRPSDSDVDAEVKELTDFFNRAPIALHWLSGTGRVLWANDTELEVLGYTRDEYVGKDIMQFCPDSEEDVLEIFKELGSGNTVRDVPVRFRTKDGDIRDLLVDSNVNYRSGGEFNHTRCFIRDDTGRKVREARAQVALESSTRLAEQKQMFVSKLLHEIRTPVHIMSMISDPSHPTDSDTISSIKSQTDRLTRLVTSVSNAVKFDDGYVIPLNESPCDIGGLIEGIHRDTLNAGHRKILERVPDYQTVLVDAKILVTTLEELVTYSMERTRSDGTTVLRVSHDSQKSLYTFEVSDEGPVLTATDVQRVFHNFWLSDINDGLGSSGSSISSETSSLDICLNIAFNYVQCLGSALDFVSDVSGTRFSFVLKLENTDATALTVENVERWERLNTSREASKHVVLSSGSGDLPTFAEGVGLGLGSSKHILLVEDNTICQKVCEALLKRMGHTCDTADNGSLAVDMVSKDVEMYDLILMDLRMPVMDGIESARRMKESGVATPIVAFSAEEEGEAREAAIEAGMVDFLGKPASSADISRVLEGYA